MTVMLLRFQDTSIQEILTVRVTARMEAGSSHTGLEGQGHCQCVCGGVSNS